MNCARPTLRADRITPTTRGIDVETVLLIGPYSAAYLAALDCYVVRGMNGTPICRASTLEHAAAIMQSLQDAPAWN